ncbi:MAG: arsenate reductase [Brevundimonas sp.]|uniref:arsenate reductase n=1 Tax=Brevundimonas sp. TaxID=1871086 RepID=UPI00391C9D40
MTLILYGIPNCDTVRKARADLDARAHPYRFHNFKTEGVTEDDLKRWIAAHGWEKVLNRSGLSFRKLPDADKANLDAAKAIALMLANPSMIKRPVLEREGGESLIGYRPGAYDDL